MTHFNHEWNSANPAVPVSVGDRYYAQDLNDDFNYLKHLPYEVFLQGRSRGVMITPNDTWDNDTNSLTLSGGFGAVLQDCIELNPDEDFTIPPKTHSSPRYERIPFTDTTLVLPNDGTVHYIVATPTKRSLLQRTKSLFTEQYASRVRYDGVITIQDTTPTAGQILVGLCYDKEYCLLIDINPNQCKDNIILKKWFGQAKITDGFVTILQNYYNTSISSIETKISIEEIDVDGVGIGSGSFHNCTINVGTVNKGRGIGGGNFYNCTISIETVNGGSGIGGGSFHNCTINVGTVNKGRGIGGGNFNTCTISIETVNSGVGISGGSSFHNCTISIGTVDSYGAGISGGSSFYNCSISIGTVNSGGGISGGGSFHNCTISIGTVNSYGVGISGGSSFYNCSISIGTVDIAGISGGSSFYNCSISIGTVNSNAGISNVQTNILFLTYIQCSTTTDLSSTGGKLNVLNDTVLHAS